MWVLTLHVILLLGASTSGQVAKEAGLSGSGNAAAAAVLTAAHQVDSALEALCMQHHCLYEQLNAHFQSKSDLEDYWTALMCVKYNHGCPLDGKWGEWEAWSECSAQCGLGEKFRTRFCDDPRPMNKGSNCPKGKGFETMECKGEKCIGDEVPWSTWSAWSKCEDNCGRTTQNRVRACEVPGDKVNEMKTPVCRGPAEETRLCNGSACMTNGGWTSWGRYSRCTSSCDWGVSVRERTCTDPAPKGKGKGCEGRGSDVVNCFAAPCADHTGTGIEFDGTGSLIYKPSGVDTHSMYINMRFKATNKDGVLLHRYHTDCQKNATCQFTVLIELRNGHPVLVFHSPTYKFEIAAKSKVTLNCWQNLEVGIFHTTAFLQHNDHVRMRQNLPYTLPIFDHDQTMRLGSKDGTGVGTKGFQGTFAKIQVNYKTFSFKVNGHLKVFGVPVSSNRMVHKHLDLEADYPYLDGVTHVLQRMPEVNGTTFTLHVVISPAQPSGLILYNQGQVEGTFVALQLVNWRLVASVNTGGPTVSTSLGGIEKDKWIYVRMDVEPGQVMMRVNRNSAADTAIPGKMPYKPGPDLYIGAVPKPVSAVLKMDKMIKVDGGFKGLVHSYRVGTQVVSLKDVALSNVETGHIISIGMPEAGKYRSVVEPSNSIIFLKCDTSAYAEDIKAGRSKVFWMKDGATVTYCKTIQPVKTKNENSCSVTVLSLHPTKHLNAREGVYACVVHDLQFLHIVNVDGVVIRSAQPITEMNIEDHLMIAMSCLGLILLLGLVFLYACIMYGKKNPGSVWDRVFVGRYYERVGDEEKLASEAKEANAMHSNRRCLARRPTRKQAMDMLLHTQEQMNGIEYLISTRYDAFVCKNDPAWELSMLWRRGKKYWGLLQTEAELVEIIQSANKKNGKRQNLR